LPPTIPLLKGLVADNNSSLATVLSRQYPVATFPWSTTDPLGASLATVNFPDVILTKNFMQSKIANFAHFRAGVSITARINGNKFLYGTIMLSWEPATDLTPSTSLLEGGLYGMSGNPHILMNINDAIMPTLIAPFHSNQPMIDLETYASGAIGTLNAHVMVPLNSVSSTTTNTVQVTLYANFTDIVLSTPTGLTLISTPTPFIR